MLSSRGVSTGFYTLRQGFSLLELLVALSFMLLLMGSLFKLFQGYQRTSSVVDMRSSLVNEAQFAESVIGTRLLEAAYIYPEGSRITLGSDPTTEALVTPDQVWQVGRDPFIAMIVPPYQASDDHVFYAYYTMPRQQYLQGSTSVRPSHDPKNDEHTWMLLEYRQSFSTPGGIFELPELKEIQNNKGYVLADYVQPTSNKAIRFSGNNTVINDALTYELFTLDEQRQKVTMQLRLLRLDKPKKTCKASQRVPKVLCLGNRVGTPVTPPLKIDILPRNAYIGTP